MPCIFKIRVVAARDLPVMDKTSELTDAYVEVRFADFDVLRTPVKRRTLNPVWNEDFRFEVSDDSDLQNEPLEMRVLDYDTISTNDAIGSVYIDVDPLLSWDSDIFAEDGSTLNERQFNGWFPIYDTLRGIRGDLYVQIRLQFFGDLNPFKDSSAGVQFLAMSTFPVCYGFLLFLIDTLRAEEVKGLVEVLLNENDPEYHWSDTFRAPRYSNEARQKVEHRNFIIHSQLLYRLAGQLRRLVGRRVLEMGGNAVIGYQQHFDLENEESAITARAIGTCVKLSSLESLTRQFNSMNDRSMSLPSLPLLQGTLNSRFALSYFNSRTTSLPVSTPEHPDYVSASPRSTISPPARATQSTRADPFPVFPNSFDQFQPSSSSPLKFSLPISPKTEDVDADVAATSTTPPSSTPEAHRRATIASIFQMDESKGDLPALSPQLVRPPTAVSTAVPRKQQKSRILTEHSLYTLQHNFPTSSIDNLGGVVSARSVKLLQDDDTDVREAWWDEIREEIRSHAKVLGCSSVIGYSEKAVIQDELCVLSAIGTAANVDFPALCRDVSLTAYLAQKRVSAVSADSVSNLTKTPSPTSNFVFPSHNLQRKKPQCRLCHIPYKRSKAPFPMSFTKCTECEKRYVPEILMATIDVPADLKFIGQACYLEAHICRPKKRKEGETNAAMVSDAFPFVEYDIHRQLLYKLRIQGLNAVFALSIQMAIGDNLIVAIASATAVYLPALPAPPSLRITRNLDVVDAEDRQLLAIQRRIVELSEMNRKRVELARQSAESSCLQSAEHRRSSLSPSTFENELSGSQSSLLNDSALDSASITDGSINPTLLRALAISDDENSDDDDDLETPMDHPQTISSFQHPSTGAISSTSAAVVVVQIDDDTDEDLIAVLLDPQHPDSFQMFNSENIRVQSLLPLTPTIDPRFTQQTINLVKEGTISVLSHHPNRQLSAIIRELYDELRLHLLHFKQCVVMGIRYDIQLQKDSALHIRLLALVIGIQNISTFAPTTTPTSIALSDESKLAPPHQQHVDDLFLSPNDAQDSLGVAPTPLQFEGTTTAPTTAIPSHSSVNTSKSSHSLFVTSKLDQDGNENAKGGDTVARDTAAPSIVISPLSTVPGFTVTAVVGRLNLHFIKEEQNLHHAHGHHYSDTSHYYNSDVILEDGLGSFIHQFLVEVQAIARAYTIAMGGNALLAFNIDYCSFKEPLKNQAYGLLSLSGDIVELKADGETADLIPSAPSSIDLDSLYSILWPCE